MNWSLGPLLGLIPIAQVGKGWQAGQVQVDRQHISAKPSLLKVGQGPPVSACALPWANNAWNAPRDSVPGELASSARCSDRAARPSPHSPKSGGFLPSDSNRGRILDPFGGLPTACPPWPVTAPSGNGRRRGLWLHQAGRWGRLRGRGSCHVVTIGPLPAPSPSAQLCSLL